MTDQEKASQSGVHHATVRGARASLAKKEISGESFEAVLAGDLSLEEARELGRNAGPGGPAVRADKTDRSRECMCGCGRTTNGRFAMGHDARVKSWIVKAVRTGTLDELSEEIQQYADERDLIRQTQERMAAEEQTKAKAKEE